MTPQVERSLSRNRNVGQSVAIAADTSAVRKAISDIKKALFDLEAFFAEIADEVSEEEKAFEAQLAEKKNKAQALALTERYESQNPGGDIRTTTLITDADFLPTGGHIAEETPPEPEVEALEILDLFEEEEVGAFNLLDDL